MIKSKTGNLILMSNTAKKLDDLLDFNAEAMLAEAYAEIASIKKSKASSLPLKKLVRATGTPEHLKEIFEHGHTTKVPQGKAKP